jgi:anti-sigma regulatory factor (Ser/Thr protein kinase)
MLIAIADQSQIAASRRTAEALARNFGFDELRAGRLALIATEMASNILKHATHGHLMVAPFADSTGAGVELLAMDKGPGIGDVTRSLQDGYSTTGTPGTGLGAIRRQADIFDIYSRPGAGTVVMARVLTDDHASASGAADCELGIVLVPYPGEIECGDSWAFGLKSGVPTLLAVDGSGHGPQAASAAQRAVEAFEKGDQMDSVRIMETIHRALAPTRGAAVAVARVDREARLVRFSGIGNISAAVVSEGSTKRMISHNGTAGHVASRIREFTYPFAGSPTVLLHSDGVSAKWELEAYPGLAVCRPSVIAGVISRDFRRSTDDALIVVMRAAA